MKRGRHRQHPELLTVTSCVRPTAWPGSEGKVTEQSAEYSAENSGSENPGFRGMMTTQSLNLRKKKTVKFCVAVQEWIKSERFHLLPLNAAWCGPNHSTVLIVMTRSAERRVLTSLHVLTRSNHWVLSEARSDPNTVHFLFPVQPHGHAPLESLGARTSSPHVCPRPSVSISPLAWTTSFMLVSHGSTLHALKKRNTGKSQSKVKHRETSLLAPHDRGKIR